FADLVGGPLLGRLHNRFRHIAFCVVIEQVHLPAQADVDGQNDLLDRREAEELVRTDVARSVDQLLRSEIHGGQTFENLLIRNHWWRRRSAHRINLAGDGGSIDDLKSIKRLTWR